MTDDDDHRPKLPEGPIDDTPPVDAVDDLPTVTCSRCDREWDLAYELDVRHAGNDAVEQFALDHHRHTGHFPDDVSPWVVECRHCPQRDQYLSERPARRFAETHARHTGHEVTLDHEPDDPVTITPDEYR